MVKIKTDTEKNHKKNNHHLRFSHLNSPIETIRYMFKNIFKI